MSDTPIFEQLCREFAATDAPQACTQAVEPARGSGCVEVRRWPENVPWPPSRPWPGPWDAQAGAVASALAAGHVAPRQRAGMLLFTLEEFTDPGGQAVEMCRPIAVVLGPGADGPADRPLSLGDVLPAAGHAVHRQAGYIPGQGQPVEVGERRQDQPDVRLPVRGR